MRKARLIFRSISFLVFLSSVLFGTTSWAEKRKKDAQSAVCVAARMPEKYDDRLLKIPELIKKHVSAYKKSWKLLCQKKSSSALRDAFVRGLDLEKDLISIVESAGSTGMEGDEGKKADRLHRYLETDLPKFIPAFQGSYLEYVYFSLRYKDFQDFAQAADSEDKAFFDTYAELRGSGTFAPWYQQTWDYGGCVRFGEYDWVAALKKLDVVRTIKFASYSRILSKLERDFVYVIDGSGLKVEGSQKSICTCKAKELVANDLNKIAAFLETAKIRPELLKKIQELDLEIKQGRVTIMSDAESRCGGGG